MEELLKKLQRDPESHKGENGRVGIIAGSRDYTGAPALSAKAALRTGCDLVTILTSDSISSTVAGYSENFIVREYDSDYFGMNALGQAFELAEWADAVVIGPGLGEPDKEAVKEFVSETRTPLIVDADAIETSVETDISGAILTPHKAEFEAIEQSLENILEKNNVVVKKGAKDTIYTRDEETEIEVGHPTMTVGGTGDVLTGVIASLISQGLGLEEAAILGTWLNGKAGEKAAEEYGNGALATDIIQRIPEVIR